jgi:hypothetical protein
MTILRIEPAPAVAAVRAYNAGSYRGRRNVDVDRAAYDRFRGGLPKDERSLIECVRFVGEEYGGAQRRFLPHGYREEAALIVARLAPDLDDWLLFVRAARPLVDESPDELSLTLLLRPFEGTMRWPVWASKTLHFLRPDAFPILDSRAKKAIGSPSLGSSPRDYARFCSALKDLLEANAEAMAAACNVDGGTSPSDLKLLDKILYQICGP